MGQKKLWLVREMPRDGSLKNKCSTYSVVDICAFPECTINLLSDDVAFGKIQPTEGLLIAISCGFNQSAKFLQFLRGGVSPLLYD